MACAAEESGNNSSGSGATDGYVRGSIAAMEVTSSTVAAVSAEFSAP